MRKGPLVQDQKVKVGALSIQSNRNMLQETIELAEVD
jgi:hypothetical protein